jgi:hypothetical protein
MRLELNLKDQNFVDANNRELRPFAFICHDHKDKNAVARPIAKRLRQDLGTVWYDEFSIKVGDSLRESIESGIKSSDRCIIVLSKNFLKNETWAKREFDSIYIREIVEKKRVMLPIWVDITREDLYQYSPILADRAGQLWSDGLETVVGNLILAIRTTGNDDRNSETIDR